MHLANIKCPTYIFSNIKVCYMFDPGGSEQVGDTDYNGLWTGDDWDSPIGKTLSFILQWRCLIKHSFSRLSMGDNLSGKATHCPRIISFILLYYPFQRLCPLGWVSLG